MYYIFAGLAVKGLKLICSAAYLHSKFQNKNTVLLLLLTCSCGPVIEALGHHAHTCIQQPIPILSWASTLELHTVSVLRYRLGWTPARNNEQTKEGTNELLLLLLLLLPLALHGGSAVERWTWRFTGRGFNSRPVAFT